MAFPDRLRDSDICRNGQRGGSGFIDDVCKLQARETTCVLNLLIGSRFCITIAPNNIG